MYELAQEPEIIIISSHSLFMHKQINKTYVHY